LDGRRDRQFCDDACRKRHTRKSVDSEVDPRPAAFGVYPRPIETPDPTGMRAELHWCETHRSEFLKTYIPNLEVWSGGCSQCSLDAALDQKAREILATRQLEVIRRCRIDTAQVALEVEDALAAAIADLRPRLEQQIGAEHGQRAREAAEHQLLEEIRDELARGA